MMSLEAIIEGLKKVPRMGNEKDEPEGSRYIQLSKTLVKDIVETLESLP